MTSYEVFTQDMTFLLFENVNSSLKTRTFEELMSTHKKQYYYYWTLQLPAQTKWNVTPLI